MNSYIKIKTYMFSQLKNIVSISEANQNFSKVVKKLDEERYVLIFKNNKPKYTVLNYDDSITLDEKIELIARRILQQHKNAFEELAK